MYRLTVFKGLTYLRVHLSLFYISDRAERLPLRSSTEKMTDYAFSVELYVISVSFDITSNF